MRYAPDFQHSHGRARRGSGAPCLVPLKKFARVCLLAWLTLLTFSADAQQTNGFVCQTITLPEKTTRSRFMDLNNNGRPDLVAIDPLAGKLMIYRRHDRGFANAPDQVI